MFPFQKTGRKALAILDDAAQAGYRGWGRLQTVAAVGEGSNCDLSRVLAQGFGEFDFLGGEGRLGGCLSFADTVRCTALRICCIHESSSEFGRQMAMQTVGEAWYSTHLCSVRLRLAG